MASQFVTLIGQSAAVTRSKVGHTKRFFLFIKSAANVLFVSDKFYKVVLVFYSLPLSVYMSSL